MIDLAGITALSGLLGRVGTIRSSILQLGAPALRLTDLVAGTGLVAFALLLGLRTFQPN